MHNLPGKDYQLKWSIKRPRGLYLLGKFLLKCQCPSYVQELASSSDPGVGANLARHIRSEYLRYAVQLCCTILYYTILYYTILYYTILYYTILYYTILYCTILYYTVRYCTILYYILYYTTLYYVMLYYLLLRENVLRPMRCHHPLFQTQAGSLRCG